MIKKPFLNGSFSRFSGLVIFSVGLLGASLLHGGCAGMLDPTFNPDGVSFGPQKGLVITDFAPGTKTSDDEVFLAQAVALQCDGKIVVVGNSDVNDAGDFAIARYNPDGSLDTTFGSNGDGLVTTDFAAGTETSNDFAQAVALQCDGKIVVVGFSDASGLDDFAIARYNPDGSLDQTFGSNSDGKVITDFAAGPALSSDFANAVAIQCDGKIVVVGSSTASGQNDFAVARYNPDGSLDPTFTDGVSGDGKVLTDFAVGTDTRSDFAHAVAIQCDGKIVVVGFSASEVEGNDFAIARYNPDGRLDTTFNPNSAFGPQPGLVLTDFAAGTALSIDDVAQAVAIQCDGKIVVAGNSNASGSNDFAVARYNSDGSLDTTFNPNSAFGPQPGLVTTNFGPSLSDDQTFGIAIQCDGKIVVAGFSGAVGSRDFALARYNPDGSLDPTFNPDGSFGPQKGLVITDFAAGTVTSDDQGFSIALQCDGKIVVAGISDADGSRDFALARYLPGCLPTANDKSITTRQNKAVVALDSSDIGTTFSAGDNQVIDISSLQVTQNPQNGLAIVTPSLGTITYRPDAGFVGTDTFKYTIKDALVCCCCCPCGPCEICVTDGTEIIGTECLQPCDRAFACSSSSTCDLCKHCGECALESEQATVTITVESPPIIVSYPGYRPH